MTNVNFEKFYESDVKVLWTKKKCHLDGITWVDVFPKYKGFATCSYDCCAYIWSIETKKRLGAFFLGSRDPTWKFKVDDDLRKEEENKQATELLKQVDAANADPKTNKEFKRKF